MKAPQLPIKLKPLHLIGLVAAGGLSLFVGINTLGSSKQPASTPAAPPKSVRVAVKEATSPAQAVPASPADKTPPRISAEVKQNPFGPLNLAATTEPPPPPPPPAPTPKPVKAPPVQPPAPVVVAAAPPQPPAVVSPPKPVAPPVPFTVVGSIQGQKLADGNTVAFLKNGNELIVVKQGDEINKTYRVESVTQDKIDLTYLPLNTSQSIQVPH